jgi:hypothetical protein
LTTFFEALSKKLEIREKNFDSWHSGDYLAVYPDCAKLKEQERMFFWLLLFYHQWFAVKRGRSEKESSSTTLTAEPEFFDWKKKKLLP